MAVALCCATTGTAWAQAPSASRPNVGAITFTGGLDMPTLFVYRGIVQEGDPQLTLTPYGDLGIALVAGDRRGSLRANVGVWNSLNTGSAGSGGPLNALHYTEQFSATLTIGLAKGTTLTPGYLANTSPNRSYKTVREMNVRIAQAGWLAPYGLVAFELSDAGQEDGGSTKGTYLEIGAGPNFRMPLLNARLALPVKAGFSLGHYYELLGNDLAYRDHRFGFFDVGGLVTAPMAWVAPRFGSWSVRGGADVIMLGDTTKAFNRGEKTTFVARVGVGVTY